MLTCSALYFASGLIQLYVYIRRAIIINYHDVHILIDCQVVLLRRTLHGNNMFSLSLLSVFATTVTSNEFPMAQ